MLERPISRNLFSCNYKFAPRDEFDSTYRKVHQAANYISYDKNPHSVTREDFALKCLEPKAGTRTSNNKCMPLTRKSRNLSPNEGQYDNINPSLLQKLDGTSSTFKRVMHSADILPASQYQKSITAKDGHRKPFDINDYMQSTNGTISGHDRDMTPILSMLQEKGPFDNKTSNRHADYEKDVDETKCTFLRVMQAVDWENPEPISKTMYESDFVSKVSNSPSRIINKSLLDPSTKKGVSSHICNDAYKSRKHCEANISPKNYCSNDNIGSIKEDFRKKQVGIPDRICKKETCLSKFQYSEPLLFPTDHCEMTAPLVHAKDVCKRWSQITENTQSKHSKTHLKLDGKCLPCYKKAMRSPEKSTGQSHTFIPPTTEQVLDNCKQPKWTVTLENINPNYFRRDDFADSTNKRVYQAADRVISEVPQLSETAESFQRTVELLPDAKATERKANIAVPSKAKSYAEFITPNVGEFPFTKESYLRTSDLRNIVSADAFKGYNLDLKSVTKSDFHPKMPSCGNGVDVLDSKISKNSPRVQFRKTRSQLTDLHCPKREGINKFMDDEDLTLLRNYRR